MAKVLLIEDDSETAEEITAELADRGFEVEWSANGIEGLDKARSSRPDAMIVDRLLPGMDGLTVVKTLRANSRTYRLPILMLTARTDEPSTRAGFEAGVTDYVTKPFSVPLLIARVHACLARTQLP